MKKQLVASALASSLLLGMITTTGFAETSGTSFRDINNSYAKDAIMELQSKGILNGIGNEQFNPKGTLTRAEFVTVIVKALGLETDSKISSFNDVSDWAIPYVETAFKLEIINGVGQGKFAPNAPITREMAVVILVRALQSAGVEIELNENAPLHFTDANVISDWARAYVSAGYKLGLIKGNPDGSFDPKGNTNREMSAVLGKNLLTAIENTPKPSEPEQKPDETKPETRPETPAPSVPSAPPSSGGGGIYVPPAQPSGDLATAKTTAKGQLDSYVDPADYTRNGTALTDALTTGKANIDAATDEAGVTSALAAAKAAIDAIKSDADLAADD
ncbi:S-layer homology domain-containing protein, partial [Paenibacillus illinoisensis]|uniref:S-layer homology domain-containing protein n=2 Tax=Paenibacillus illinoisensis TaxID=59845 RepID=UPI00301C539A